MSEGNRNNLDWIIVYSLHIFSLNFCILRLLLEREREREIEIVQLIESMEWTVYNISSLCVYFFFSPKSFHLIEIVFLISKYWTRPERCDPSLTQIKLNQRKQKRWSSLTECSVSISFPYDFFSFFNLAIRRQEQFRGRWWRWFVMESINYMNWAGLKSIHFIYRFFHNRNSSDSK